MKLISRRIQRGGCGCSKLRHGTNSLTRSFKCSNGKSTAARPGKTGDFMKQVMA